MLHGIVLLDSNLILVHFQMGSSAPWRTYYQIKEEIHQLFTSTLLPSIDASLTLTESCRDCENCYEQGSIPYESLGHETLSQFLGSMKDVIQMRYYECPIRCYLVKRDAHNQKRPKRQVRLFHPMFCAQFYIFFI